MAKLGILGIGNMGEAILKGLVRTDIFSKNDIYINRRGESERNAIASTYGVHASNSSLELINACDYILLAVKPIHCADLLAPLQDALENKVVISIIAGWNFDLLQKHLPKNTHIIRAMPNTPIAVAEGMTLISDQHSATAEELSVATSVFSCSGEAIVVEDHIFNAASSISGCGPAFVYMFIEALADGGVRLGVPRKLAYQLAAQTLLGSGKMVLQTGQHPGVLKDAVCSPGGTTIEGVMALEEGKLRASVMTALEATVNKTANLLK